MKKINVMQTLDNYAEIKNRLKTNILPTVAKYFKADSDTFSYEIDNELTDIFVVKVFDDYDTNKGIYYIPIEYINKENINIDDYRKQEIAYMRKKKELEIAREKDKLRKQQYQEYKKLCELFKDVDIEELENTMKDD